MSDPYPLYEFRVRRFRRGSRAAERATKASDIAPLFSPFFKNENREIFMVASLDTKNQVLGIDCVAVGSPSGVGVHPREVFLAAVIVGATAIIAAHNHPSGSLEPSVDDLALTQRLAEAGTVLGIPLLDHLILTDGGGYLSIADRIDLKPDPTRS